MGDLVGLAMAEEENPSPEMTPPTKIADDSIGFRRNSTGKKISSTSTEKPVPHYLRASTGSCHDMCKYGHKNSTEEPKPWRSTLRRSSAAKPTESHVSEETIASFGKKKKSSSPLPSVAVNLKRSSKTRRSLDSLNPSRNITPLVKEIRAEVPSKPSKEKEKSFSEKKIAKSDSARGLNVNDKKRIVPSRAASMKVSPKPTLVTGLNIRKQKGPKNEAREREPESMNAEICEDEEKIVYVVKTNVKENDFDTNTKSIVYLAKTEAKDDAFYSDKSENFSPTLEDDEKIVYVVETEAKVDTLDSDQSDKAIEMKNRYAVSEPNYGIEGSEVDQAFEFISKSENSEKRALEMEEIETETESENEPETRDVSSEQGSLLLEAAAKEGEEYNTSESEADTCQETSEIEEKARRRSFGSAREEEEKARAKVDTLDSDQSDKTIEMMNRYAESERNDQIESSEIDKKFEFISKSENGEKMALELEEIESETETDPETHDATSEQPSLLLQEEGEEEEYSTSESEADTCSENRRSSSRLVGEEKEEEEKARKMKFRRGTVVELRPEDNEAPRRLRFRRRNPLENRNGGSVGPEDSDPIKRHKEIREEEEEEGEEPEYTTSESEADNCLETSKVEEKARRRSLGLVREEEEKARKMKFRRGTVLEIRPEDNEAPRRLRYRRRNQDTLGSSESGGRRGRYYKERREEEEGGDSVISGETTGAGAPKMVVVLKHHDRLEEESPGKRKEGRRVLFNNVIEETASKLIVESRKSKVKALVGAFETVISLQDRKKASSNNNAG